MMSIKIHIIILFPQLKLRKSMQKHAKFLNKKYGWNVVPLYYLSRDYSTGDKKVKTIEWKKYKSEPYPLDNWNDSYKALAIITGQISNLTVLDIDSQEVLDAVLSQLNFELDDMSEYIVKTYNGYQFFYEYEPNLRTRIGIKDKIDFLNGGITFAVDTNDSYEVIKSGSPKKIPQALKDLIIDNEIEAETDDIKLFEEALRENSQLPYKYPLQPIIKDFLNSKRLSNKLKSKLEEVFCTKNYSNYVLSDFSKEGQKHTSTLYVAGIVASSPTVDKDLYVKFMKEWSSRVAKIDMTDSREQSLVSNRIKAGMKYFRYDIEWKSKVEDFNNPTKVANNSGFKSWYNPEEDKYVIYLPQQHLIEKYSKVAFKDALIREVKIVDPETSMSVDNIDVTTIEKIYDTFDPTIDDEFFINENGIKMHNNFKRSKMLSYFQTCEPRDKLPKLIGDIINHVYPKIEERDLFLHNLAYHMTYLQVAPTMFVLTGKSGTGKNTLFQTVLGSIYGKTHLTTSADSLTGRFRNSLKNKLLVFIDEVSEKNHKPTERGSIHNVIKQIVANPDITIESKGVDEKTYPNHAFYVMASNKDIPFKLEEGFDRRINITKTKNENVRELDWFPSGNSNDINKIIENEIPEFVEYLASIELDPDKYHKVIENNQRADLISSSISLTDKYSNAIIDLDMDLLNELDHDMAEEFEKRFIIDNRSYIEAKELKNMIPSVYSGVAKVLKANNMYTVKRINNVAKRVYIINPKGKSATEEALEAFDKMEEF